MPSSFSDLRPKNADQSHDSLRGVYDPSTCVAGPRRTGHQHRTGGVPEGRMPIREIYVFGDFGRIQQNDKIVRQEANCVDPQIRFARGHATGLGDSHRRANNRYVDVASSCPIRVFLGS
jgi:hypothetical protein